MCDSICVRSNSETESGKVGARGWGRENRELLFNGDRPQFGKIKEVQEMGGGDGCKTM